MTAPDDVRPAVPTAGAARLVVVPGLHGSGTDHWQTWLEGQVAGAVRVEQDAWSVPDLARWADRVVETLAALGPGPHAIVAHSFGCLATLHALSRRPGFSIGRLLLVAPAEPARFDVADRLPAGRLGVPACLVASDTDPWMSASSARAWALRWGCDWFNLGDAGHVNVASGFRTFEFARDWSNEALRRLSPVEAEDAPSSFGFDQQRWRVAA